MKPDKSKTTTVTLSIHDDVLKIEYDETARQELLNHSLNRMLDGRVFSASQDDIQFSNFLQIRACNDPLDSSSHGWYFLPTGTLVIKTENQSVRNDLVNALKLGSVNTNKLPREDMSKNTVMAYHSNERQRKGIYFEVTGGNKTRSTVTKEDLAQEKSVSFTIKFTGDKIESRKIVRYLKDGRLDQSEEAYRKQFLDVYDGLLAHAGNSVFGFFSTSPNMENWTLNKIMEHAEKNNDISRKTCIQLGWMHSNGRLTGNAPQAIKLAENGRIAIDV